MAGKFQIPEMEDMARRTADLTVPIMELQPTLVEITAPTIELQPTLAELTATIRGAQPTLAEITAPAIELQPTLAELTATIRGAQPTLAEITAATIELQPTLEELTVPIREAQHTIAKLAEPYRELATTYSNLSTQQIILNSFMGIYGGTLRVPEMQPSTIEKGRRAVENSSGGGSDATESETFRDQVDELILTYIDKLAFYVPMDFESEVNNQFRRYYISAFIDNHKNNKVQLAYLCFHIIFMTSLYKQFWLLKAYDALSVEHLCRNNKEYNSFNGFFEVSSDSEKNYINHIMGVLGFDRNQKKKVMDLVDVRDQCAHAYGEIYYNTVDDVEHYYKEALKWTEKIQVKTQSQLMRAFYKKIADFQGGKDLLSGALTDIIVKKLNLSLSDCKTIIEKYKLSECKKTCEDFNADLQLSIIMVIIRLHYKLEQSIYSEAYVDGAESFKLLLVGELIKNTELAAGELEKFQISVENELTLCKDDKIISMEAFDELSGYLNNKILEKQNEEVEFDFFVSYAKEDEETIVSPLVDKLKSCGAHVWIDSTEISLGDNIRRNIDKGLERSRFGVVVLSKHYVAKSWTNYEFEALMQRQLQSEKVILPIWHNISLDDVKKFSPILLNISAMKSSSSTIEEIAQQLIQTLG